MTSVSFHISGHLRTVPKLAGTWSFFFWLVTMCLRFLMTCKWTGCVVSIGTDKNEILMNFTCKWTGFVVSIGTDKNEILMNFMHNIVGTLNHFYHLPRS